jgi:PAS domain S-box-containing protein
MWFRIASALTPHGRDPWVGYAVSAVAVALATPLVVLLEQWVHRGISVYLLPVVLAAGLYGRGPGLLAVVLAVVGYTLLVVNPSFPLSEDALHRISVLLLLLVAALVLAEVVATLRQRAERRLSQSQQRFRTLIEHSSDVIALLDRDGVVTYLSPSTSRVLEDLPGGIVGRQMSSLIHPADQDRFEQVCADLLMNPGQTCTFRHRARGHAGRWCWLEITATQLLDEPVLGAVVLNMRDVSAEVEAQQHLEERVEARTRELAALYQADELLHRSLRLEDVARALAEAAIELLGGSVSIVAVWDREHTRLVPLAAQGVDPEFQARLAGLPAVEELRQATIRAGEMVVDDLHNDPRIAPEIRAVFQEFGLRSAFSVPMTLGSEVLGTFSVDSPQPAAFGVTEQRLLRALAQRGALAIQNARLYEQAGQLAALEERQRLARELHDSVSQVLYGIALTSSTAARVREREPSRLGGLLQDVLTLAEGGLAEMRALIFELQPEALHQEGLVAALDKQAAAVQARHGIAVHTTLGPEPAVPETVKEALYRIGQEALHNAAKHARAHAVQVTLAVEGEALALTVSDDGRGFDPTGSFPGHLGLRSMQERATAAGGTLHVESAPGQGTRVCAQVALTPAG